MTTHLVLIHGMWSTPETVMPLANTLAKQGFKVHTPALPGHVPIAEMAQDARQQLVGRSVADYVNAVLAVVDALPSPPVIVGHSMGGLVAQLVAARVACHKLVLLSSAPPAGVNPWSFSVMKTMGKNLFIFPLWRKLTSLGLKNIQYGIANTQTADVQQRIYSNATFESGLASWEIGMWFLYSRPVTRVNFDNIDCPVLILGGEEDKVTPIRIQKAIADRLGDRATLVRLPGVCHWTVADGHLPIVSQAILNWIQTHE